MCNIWLRSDGRVERKGGYRHTDSRHEWLQDNFYGGSATKRIVIKEPSLGKLPTLCRGPGVAAGDAALPTTPGKSKYRCQNSVGQSIIFDKRRQVHDNEESSS